METPPLKRRKQKFLSVLPLSVAAHRQLLRKILPPVSPLLNTLSTSMIPTVYLLKMSTVSLDSKLMKKSNGSLCLGFFYAAIYI